MDSESLKVLLNAVCRGDYNAFRLLYEEFKCPVYTVALRLLNNRSDAEEVTQDVFLKLYYLPADHGIENLRAWVFAVTRNLAVDRIRSRKTVESLDSSVVENLYSFDDYSSLDLREVISRLPNRDREILVMHIYGGLRFREISDILHIPLGTVLWRYRKTLTTLRNFMEDE
ncbi:MAG: RNA polymerase sigma factor [Clostridia bacterium]|nr:RNA polymerase sigma factor [Clostridia bacterium]